MTDETYEYYKRHNANLWIRGSRMYGIHTPDSDYDFIGVYFNREEYMNPFKRAEIKSTKNNDNALMPLDKFANLLRSGNFNALDLVYNVAFVERNPIVSNYISVIHPYAITRAAADAYMGYIKTNKVTGLVHHKKQNAARQGVIDQLGYDPKFVAHLIRGCYSLSHILRYGRYYDLKSTMHQNARQLIIRYKRGEYSKDEVEEFVGLLVRRTEHLYEEYREELPTTEMFENVTIKYFSRL